MKYLYYLYQIVISPLLLLATILTALTTTIGCTFFNAAFWSYYPGVIWSRVMIRLLLLPVHISGRENMQPGQSYVIIPNHQGSFDIFLIYGFLGRHFKWMLKEPLRNIPLVGKACESAGFIFVDQKGGPKKLKETHDRARAVLRQGVSLVVFPEGARTLDGKMHSFKRGAFQLADEVGLPLLPVTIRGSYEVLSRKRGFNFVHWHPLTLTIHPPFSIEGSGPEAEHEAMKKAEDIIGEEVD